MEVQISNRLNCEARQTLFNERHYNSRPMCGRCTRRADRQKLIYTKREIIIMLALLKNQRHSFATIPTIPQRDHNVRNKDNVLAGIPEASPKGSKFYHSDFMELFQGGQCSQYRAAERFLALSAVVVNGHSDQKVKALQDAMMLLNDERVSALNKVQLIKVIVELSNSGKLMGLNMTSDQKNEVKKAFINTLGSLISNCNDGELLNDILAIDPELNLMLSTKNTSIPNSFPNALGPTSTNRKSSEAFPPICNSEELKRLLAFRNSSPKFGDNNM